MNSRLMKAMLTGVLMVSVTAAMSGCGKNVTVNINDNNNTLQTIVTESMDGQDVSGNDSAAGETGDGVYSSSYGWTVTFEPADFAVNEVTDGASFVYQGESAGTNMVTITYAEDKGPEEVLDELTADWGDPDDIDRSESYFPGTNDKWGFWRSLNSDGEGSGLNERAFAGEYNGGTLLFEYITHTGSDEEVNKPSQDALQALTDSITYEDFEDQEMFKDYPGVYVREFSEEIEGQEHTFEESVTLNKDHSGEISIQDDLYVMWGKDKLIMADGSYDYSLDGDTLTLTMDDITMEFVRQGDASDDKKGSSLPAYKYPGDDGLMTAVYGYLIDEYSSHYEKADVSIPCVTIVGTDESNPDDICVWGDFWIFNYDLEGDTLMCESGGSYPGCIHLKKTDSGYEAEGMDVTEDGSGYTESAKKIFGDLYEDFEKINSDQDAREKTRAQIISDYVRENGLSVTKYKDFGWDAVEI